ncbi:Apoptosis-stimulating of p53 protein 1 [Fukomys damarensis]|uniref:Apoptosis-stimulating of p53 protein 1 n=1 Tax=Fukomys damarensis TaxID=885580 RepID=A0A091CLP1_FUKDA|nr:Apoptosis-stimulating of p53 protein 1 [Fukomys damarensis]
MFQEKKQEVQIAILRVNQLSQQLEDLKKGKLHGFQSYNSKLTGPTTVELKRLYQELQICNQFNQEQNPKLQQQKELSCKCSMEVAMMDKHIKGLCKCLYGKKIQLTYVNVKSSPRSPLSTCSRVAAMGPYLQASSARSYPVPGDPVKPQSLTFASSVGHRRSKYDGQRRPRVTNMWTVSDLPEKLGIKIGVGPPPIPGTASKLWDIHKPYTSGPRLHKLPGEEERGQLAQSDANLEALCRKLANAPHVLKKHNSITEPEDPSKPNIQKLLYQNFSMLAGGMERWMDPTALHASCNSIHFCKQLVESSVTIFDLTNSDIETFFKKCEELEEGHIQGSQFLYEVYENLGVIYKSVVYSLWDYEAQNGDKLTFPEGDAITILRCKSESETEWWWAPLGDREGYGPKSCWGCIH